jgi:hypothetical protein
MNQPENRINVFVIMDAARYGQDRTLLDLLHLWHLNEDFVSEIMHPQRTFRAQ